MDNPFNQFKEIYEKSKEESDEMSFEEREKDWNEKTGITFSYKNPNDAARPAFETLISAISEHLGLIENLPQRTILVGFEENDGGDIYFNENLVFDQCVGCRLTVNDLVSKIWRQSLDPRVAEATFNELRAKQKIVEIGINQMGMSKEYVEESFDSLVETFSIDKKSNLTDN